MKMILNRCIAKGKKTYEGVEEKFILIQHSSWYTTTVTRIGVVLVLYFSHEQFLRAYILILS